MPRKSAVLCVYPDFAEAAEVQAVAGETVAINCGSDHRCARWRGWAKAERPWPGRGDRRKLAHGSAKCLSYRGLPMSAWARCAADPPPPAPRQRDRIEPRIDDRA